MNNPPNLFYLDLSLCDLTQKYSIVSSFRITLETELVHKGGESHILCHLCYLFILGLFLFLFFIFF